MQPVFEQLPINFKDVSSDEDVRKAFNTREVLLKLDSRLDNFAYT